MQINKHTIEGLISIHPSVYGDERNALHKISYTTIIIPLSINTLQQIGLPRIYMNVIIIPRAITTKQTIPRHKIVILTTPGYLSSWFEVPNKIKVAMEVFMKSSFEKLGNSIKFLLNRSLYFFFIKDRCSELKYLIYKHLKM
jgi:hypothetical protein